MPLGSLAIGTTLHVHGGGEAILISKTWRQADIEVFDFEVEEMHNFYVRGEGSNAAGVLVHNSTGFVVFKHRPNKGNGHHSMEVFDADGNSLGDFEQVVGGRGRGLEGRSTTMEAMSPSSRPVAGQSRPFAVDDTKAVLRELESPQFPYSAGDNSCIHALCRAAKAGGASLPSRPRDQTNVVKQATGAK